MHAHFSGLRFLLYHHPVFSSFVGISSIGTLVFTLLYLFWKRLFEPAIVVNLGSSEHKETSDLESRRQKARETLRRSSTVQKISKRVAEDLERERLAVVEGESEAIADKKED